ncbi:zinc-binding dehydrogenase [Microterricola gilva]|uniref:zinc-binding dehydrogenase n=1 Tax=Microterricola gilva TaxID=393267 RepID=UPI001F5FA54A|nr:zinc-binding dehydrogenase [Microterricola gilva]
MHDLGDSPDAVCEESGRFRAVIDRSYDLSDIVEAHRYVDTGRKRGNVVLRVAAAGPAA